MSDYLLAPVDLNKVYKVTYPARNRWKNILLALDISSDTMTSISTRCRDDPGDCLCEVLIEWLNGGKGSWQNIVRALSSPTVGQIYLARTIEKEYIHSTTDGQIINADLKISLDQRLGKGAFGAVFKGNYRGEHCAVKVLLHDALEMQTGIPAGKNGEDVKAFDRECKMFKSFQHPNVTQFLSTAQYSKSGNTILVVELMDCNLRTYLLDEESLTSECEISLSRDIACGLAYIHSKDIIHRDLCGDNVLLKKRTQLVPVAKISDFGMSRLYDASEISHFLTIFGHRMGYLPPEAITKKYDSSLDVFSLGAIMVQIVCKLETIKSAKDRSDHLLEIPSTHRLWKLINSCLQEDMRRRPSARDICSLTTDPVEVLPPGWRKEENMPFGTSYNVETVVIGDTVYVGGGDAGNDRDRCTVMKLEQDQWTKLQQYTFEFFAMTSLANRLVLVGGWDRRNKKPTNQLAVLESGDWSHDTYPPMRKALYSSTAVSFNNHIIVAGGDDDEGPTSSVEVLDVASRRWYIARSLPKNLSHIRSTLIGKTLYLMGGYNSEGRNKTVCHIDLKTLIAKTTVSQPTLWQSIEDTPLEFSAPLSIGKSLLAVGGRDSKGKASSSIHLYQPDTRKWVKLENLPTARFNCTCSVLSSGEIFIAGGKTETGEFTNNVLYNFSLYVSVIATL